MLEGKKSTKFGEKVGQGKEGVMKLKQNPKVTEVRYRSDSEGVMAVQVLVKGGEKGNFTAYISPKTKNWYQVRYNAMLEHTIVIDRYNGK